MFQVKLLTLVAIEYLSHTLKHFLRQILRKTVIAVYELLSRVVAIDLLVLLRLLLLKPMQQLVPLLSQFQQLGLKPPNLTPLLLRQTGRSCFLLSLAPIHFEVQRVTGLSPSLVSGVDVPERLSC